MLRDIIGDESAKDVAETIGEVLQKIKQIGWKEVKPWKEFFAVFKAPQWSLKHLQQRLVSNLSHYRSNYAILSLSIFTLRLILNPVVLFILLLCTIFSIVILFVIKQPIQIGEFVLDGRAKTAICIGTSSLILILSGALEQLLWSIIYILLLCGSHMIFRPRSVTSKAGNIYEELNVSGYSWFGGQLKNENSMLKENDDIENPDGDDRSNDLSGTTVRRRNAPTGTDNFSNVKKS